MDNQETEAPKRWECAKAHARRNDISERTLWRKVKDGIIPKPSYHLGPHTPRFPVTGGGK